MPKRLKDCLEKAKLTGKLDPDQIGLILKRTNQIEKTLAREGTLSPEQAVLVAEKQAIEHSLETLALVKSQKVKQILTLAKNIEDINAHPRGVGVGVMSKLVRDLRGEAPWSNIDNRSKVIAGQAHAKMADMMSNYRTKKLGFSQNQAGVRNMVRELFGQNSGDADAKFFSKQWADTAEWLRQRFNRAGGNIAKLEEWGLPQFHDQVRVKRMGREKWKEEITELLDWDKMMEKLGPDVDLEDIGRHLDRAFDRITTNGLVDLVPGRMGGSKLANRHQDPRYFIFKDADAWLKYHDMAGHADIYTTLTDHISRMSSEISLLEVMGPNPEASFRFLSDLARKDGYSDIKLNLLDWVWNVNSGKVNAVHSVNASDFMNTARHLTVAAKLGGAFLSSISDIAFQKITRKYNGLPGVAGMGKILRQMDPTSEADRLFAVKLGLNAEAWVSRALAANRFTEVTGANWAAKISDATMRASLLSSFTDAGRKSFGMEFMSSLAEQSGKEWAHVNKHFRSAMKRYGITKQDWDDIRAIKHLEHRGVKYLRPEDIMLNTAMPEARRNELVGKYMEMIFTETDFAVPTPDARARAISTLGTERTLIGEVTRSAFLFKSFPITIITGHLMRGMLAEGLKSKGSYLSQIFIGTTFLGGLAIQAKELSRGKDPRDMTDPKFWGAAMMQGGGAGIFGDFLFSDVNRFGGGLTKTIAGPVAAFGEDTLKLTIGNLQDAVKGEDTNAASDVVRYMRQYTPGGSLWYTRLAFERLLMDQLDKAADGGRARKSWRRMKRRRKRDYGQDFWWSPGKVAPESPPDFAKVAK